ncbi:MAG: VOC family protein [Chloroflexi bacterium]|nr:VOC family protein [Chloroflexota bacterium]MBV9597875.1 VOC family protein [Chloroflexota bacterium]
MHPLSVVTAQSLVQVAQRATDLDASVTFYRDVLGGQFLGKFDPPGLALVALGGVRLLLEADASSATLYFRVDDLDAAYQNLRQQQHVKLEDAPHLVHRDDAGQFGARGEEEWMAFLRDPAGNLIGLVERRRVG